MILQKFTALQSDQDSELVYSMIGIFDCDSVTRVNSARQDRNGDRVFNGIRFTTATPIFVGDYVGLNGDIFKVVDCIPDPIEVYVARADYETNYQPKAVTV